LQELGERIRAWRVAAEITQETAAARSGIDWRRWQRLERGEVNATVWTLARVATALGTTFWDLVCRSPRKAAP